MRNAGGMKIYLAGPLFSNAERGFLDTIAARLRAEGFEVFVPHEQFAEQKFQRADGDSTADEVYAVDLAGVMGANAVLAWLDGTQVDDGTSVEIGHEHLDIASRTRNGRTVRFQDLSGGARENQHMWRFPLPLGCKKVLGVFKSIRPGKARQLHGHGLMGNGVMQGRRIVFPTGPEQ